jgi:hypothetical protein
MIGRHHLVEIERVKELTLSALSPPIMNRSRESRLIHGITAPTQSQRHAVDIAESTRLT